MTYQEIVSRIITKNTANNGPLSGYSHRDDQALMGHVGTKAFIKVRSSCRKT